MHTTLPPYRWIGQVLLEVLKSRYALLDPLKILPLMKMLKERMTPVHRPRDEPVQGYCHPSQPLHLLGIPRRVQTVNSLDLFWIAFDSAVSNHVPLEFSRANPKRTLGCVEA